MSTQIDNMITAVERVPRCWGFRIFVALKNPRKPQTEYKVTIYRGGGVTTTGAQMKTPEEALYSALTRLAEER